MLVVTEAAGEAVRLTLNDPATRNSLSLDMIAALRESLARSSRRVTIIAANGPVFCSGHNLKEITAHRQDNDRGMAFNERLFAACTELMLDIQNHGSAVIAEVDGMASAAGCQMVASCDLAIASERAAFCTPGVNIGLFCSTPMVAVSRAVGRKHALEMLLTGDAIDANHALRIGLINRVVTADDLRGAANQLASHIANKSAEAIRIGKRAFATQSGLPVADAYAAMAEVMADNLQCDDAKEGIGAFISRRQPNWKRQ